MENNTANDEHDTTKIEKRAQCLFHTLRIINIATEQRTMKRDLIEIVKNHWRLQLPFLIFPGIALFNYLFILYQEMNSASGISPHILPATLLSFGLIAAPSVITLIAYCLLNRPSVRNNSKLLKALFDTGNWIVFLLVIVRGINSVVAVYLISGYYLESPIYFMTIMFSLTVFKYLFILPPSVLKITHSIPREYMGVTIADPESLIPDIDWKETTLVIGMAPTIKISGHTVAIPQEDRNVTHAIYVGLQLLILLEPKELRSHIEFLQKSSSPIIDWYLDRMESVTQLCSQQKNGKMASAHSPLFHFSFLFLDQITPLISDTTHSAQHERINFFDEIWQRKTLPRLNGNLHLGRKTDNWSLSLFEDMNDSESTPAFQIGSKFPELIALDKLISHTHMNWLEQQGRATSA
jgi:hypothetical protein